MLERWLEGIDTQLEIDRSGVETVDGELLLLTALIRRVFIDAGGKLPIFLEFLTKAGHSLAVWQSNVVPHRKYHAFFARMIEGGVEGGSLRPVEPDVTSNVRLPFAIGLLTLGLLDPHGTDWGKVAQEGMGMLFNGIGAR